MKLKPLNHKIKSGENILIREAKKEDAEQFIHFLLDNLSTSQFIPLYPDEFTKSVEEEIEWIESYLKKENSILLVAVFNGKIIGNIDFSGHSRQMLSHTGLIGMSILEKFRNKGLGTLLMETAISWAEEHSNLEILWLQVFGENVEGIALYKKMGFIETGRQANFFKTRSGRYFENVSMTKYLKKSH